VRINLALVGDKRESFPESIEDDSTAIRLVMQSATLFTAVDGEMDSR
jgi:hypothetical protein